MPVKSQLKKKSLHDIAWYPGCSVHSVSVSSPSSAWDWWLWCCCWSDWRKRLFCCVLIGAWPVGHESSMMFFSMDFFHGKCPYFHWLDMFYYDCWSCFLFFELFPVQRWCVSMKFGLTIWYIHPFKGRKSLPHNNSYINTDFAKYTEATARNSQLKSHHLTMSSCFLCPPPPHNPLPKTRQPGGPKKTLGEYQLLQGLEKLGMSALLSPVLSVFALPWSAPESRWKLQNRPNQLMFPFFWSSILSADHRLFWALTWYLDDLHGVWKISLFSSGLGYPPSSFWTKSVKLFFKGIVLLGRCFQV